MSIIQSSLGQNYNPLNAFSKLGGNISSNVSSGLSQLGGLLNYTRNLGPSGIKPPAPSLYTAPKNIALANVASSNNTPTKTALQIVTPPVQSPVQSVVSNQTSQNNPPNTGMAGLFPGAVSGLGAIGQGAISSPVAGAGGLLKSQAMGENYPTETLASKNQQNIQGAQGLLSNFAQTQSPEVANAREQYTEFAKQSPWQIALMKNNPNMLANIATGNAANMSAAAAEEQNALAQNVQNALVGQSQQIGAATNLGSQALTGQQQNIGAATNLGNLGIQQQQTQAGALGQAGNLAAPVTTAGLFSPLTGEPVNSQLMGTVQNILNQLAQSNTPIDNDTVKQISNLYGPNVGALVAYQAYSQGRGGFNPTSQSVAANTNAQLGAQFQTQAANLGVALSNLDNTAQTAQNILKGHPDLNSTNTPVGNEQIQTYLRNIGDTAGVANYQMVINDLNRYKNQITSTGSGLTPSAATNQTLSTDPSTLSLPQITAYAQQLKQLGQSQQAVLQGAKDNAYYSREAYSGSPASVNTSNVPTPGGGVGNLAVSGRQAGQIGTGAGLNVASWGAGALTQLRGILVGALGEALIK